MQCLKKVYILQQWIAPKTSHDFEPRLEVRTQYFLNEMTDNMHRIQENQPFFFILCAFPSACNAWFSSLNFSKILLSSEISLVVCCLCWYSSCRTEITKGLEERAGRNCDSFTCQVTFRLVYFYCNWAAKEMYQCHCLRHYRWNFLNLF